MAEGGVGGRVISVTKPNKYAVSQYWRLILVSCLFVPGVKVTYKATCPYTDTRVHGKTCPCLRHFFMLVTRVIVNKGNLESHNSSDYSQQTENRAKEIKN